MAKKAKKKTTKKDTFRRDLHKDLKADYVIANPPFNDSDWYRNDEDVRWKYGTPPKGNANFAWVQHFIHHLSPTGTAGFVLANGSMSSNQSGEGDIRRQIIEVDLVDCMVAMPGQLFYSTQIPVCLWFLTRDKSGVGFQPAKDKSNRKQDAYATRDRRGETLFIDARKMGTLIDRVHRELTEEDIQRPADTFHAWQGRGIGFQPVKSKIGNGDRLEAYPTYEDIPGFCKSASLSEIAEHGHVLTPGRYVGAEEVEDDGEPFELKMARLTDELADQFAESSKLEKAIKSNLNSIGFALPKGRPE